MSLIKKGNNKRRNYILKKDNKTKATVAFIFIVLILLIVAVVISGFVFKWF
ncbi:MULTISPECIES: hypothetical protein [Bizionia]|uniref:hypothetical protein n=1 Tax=Bizionia TaxID=283785 RepID=UPI001478A2B0|nr:MULTISPECIES: hypothetical protein [Bizionia]